MLVYASTTDLSAIPGAPNPLPDNALELLRRASELVRSLTLTARYPTFPGGLPSGRHTAEAFQRATCLQVLWWLETGDTTGTGAAGRYQSVSILGVTLTRATRQAGAAPDIGPGGVEIAPGVTAALAAASVWSPAVTYADEQLATPIGQQPAGADALALTAATGGVPTWMWRHQVVIQPKTGDGAYGPTYGTPTITPAFVVDKRRLVRDQTGAEVVSETSFACPLDTVVPVGSLVTVNGRETVVLAVSRGDGGGLPTPDHLEVACQ